MKVLVSIVISQFLCTSLWFAGNAVVDDLIIEYSLSDQMIGWVTSFVQIGFISGTLLFAIFKISDKFSPSRVFMFCALVGALFNVSVTFLGSSEWILPLRFLTGFCLAGIYPVGMKIASDYHKKGLGLALGYLVGALVLGTALPHLLKDFFAKTDWKFVFYTTSFFAMAGGLIIGIGVGDGPHRKPSQDVDFTSFFSLFKYRNFRSAALGYFGHMWELYAFWAFVPSFISSYYQSDQSISKLSFLVIGVGSIGCILGGYFSRRWGSKVVAGISLFTSLIACLISPLLLSAPAFIFLFFLIIWGMAVITDSPQFSTLVAQSAPADLTGTALTIVNSLGFAITIASIQLLAAVDNPRIQFLFLAPGPLIGLFIFWKGFRR